MAMVSGAQLRAARALLSISAADLAQSAKISLRTLQRFEASDGIPAGRTAILATVVAALEARGIAFTGDPLNSPGVALTRPTPSRAPARRPRRRPRVIT